MGAKYMVGSWYLWIELSAQVVFSTATEPLSLLQKQLEADTGSAALLHVYLN